MYEEREETEQGTKKDVGCAVGFLLNLWLIDLQVFFFYIITFYNYILFIIYRLYYLFINYLQKGSSD